MALVQARPLVSLSTGAYKYIALCGRVQKNHCSRSPETSMDRRKYIKSSVLLFLKSTYVRFFFLVAGNQATQNVFERIYGLILC